MRWCQREYGRLKDEWCHHISSWFCLFINSWFWTNQSRDEPFNLTRPVERRCVFICWLLQFIVGWFGSLSCVKCFRHTCGFGHTTASFLKKAILSVLPVKKKNCWNGTESVPVGRLCHVAASAADVNENAVRLCLYCRFLKATERSKPSARI